jgi:hypothetical protein
MRDPPEREHPTVTIPFRFCRNKCTTLFFSCYGHVFYLRQLTVIPDTQPLGGITFLPTFWNFRLYISGLPAYELRGVVGKRVQNASNHMV